MIHARGIELGKEREGEHLVGSALGESKPARANGDPGIRGLVMHGAGVMNSGANLLGLKNIA